ncbi:MAG: SCO family protein [Gammaproteobacteria bacterium]|nr:SCO family protein [Gammaproteobacteria bacterium]MDH4254373.1 SCO family protein [Gammaproteobacteria bacterium]
MKILPTLVAGVCALASAVALSQSYDRDDALAVSQAALGRTLGDHRLRDTEGQTFDLATLRGRPLVVSMIYTSCFHVCPTITQNLARSVDIGREALGDDAFSVVTVGFDWAVDTPDRMRLYAAERGIDVPGWYFLAGDESSIGALAGDLGFQFFESPKGFDHLMQTTVIDAEGRVYRQVYGIEINAQSLVEPLKELVFDTPRSAGVLEHWLDTFKLFCTVYDPNSGRYKFDYSIAMTIFVGVLCLGAIAGFIVQEWRRAA